MNLRLNGWQRLWILLSALYLALVVVAAIAKMPRSSDYINTRVHASIDAVGKYMEVSTPGYTYEGSYAVRQKHYADLSDEQILDRLHTKFAGKVDLEPIDREYKQKMQAEQATFLGYAVASWLGPITLLYAIGAAIAWVIRGFRRSDT